MKSALKMIPIVLCFCLAFGLVGCSKPTEDTGSNIDLDVSDKPSPKYVLLIGNDSRTDTIEINKPEYSDGTGRSDTIMLARIDPETYQVTLVTVPRDTQATYDGQMVKINETYRWGGPEELIKQVELLTGVKADYYLDMGFGDFEEFIDQIGGVHANVPVNMSLQDIVGGEKISLSAGDQDLDGAEALVLARTRKVYADEVMEGSRQIQNRQIVEVAINKALDDPLNTAMYAAALSENVETNFPLTELADLITDFVENKDKVKILSGTGPYEGDFVAEAGGLWLATRDEATWQKLMKVVDSGGDPTTVIPLQTPRAK